MLTALLDGRGLTVQAFSLRVGKPRSSLFRIIQGTLKPPLAEIDGWATALELDRKATLALALAAIEEHGLSSLRASLGR